MTTILSSSQYFFILILLVRFHQNTQAFTLELIHPFSQQSPFHKANISYSQMIKLINSQQKKHPISPTTFSSNNNITLHNKNIIIRPSLNYSIWGYLIKLNLGYFPQQNPPYKTYYLHFDTSSHIIWLQCVDCKTTSFNTKCFNQIDPPYPNHISKSYHPLACGVHKLCLPNKCLNNYCTYDVNYRTNESSFGVLAHETFHFKTESNYDRMITDRIVLGCGIRNVYDTFDDDSRLGGVLGMNWSPYSFVNQISSYSYGRFSYCLSPLIYDGDQRLSTNLRFGADVHALDGLRSVAIRKEANDDNYYVNLQGISINKMRLKIPSQYFKKTEPDHGGCIFSTGTSYTVLPRQAFKILKRNIIHHLNRADSSLKKQRGTRGFNLCFRRYQPFKWYDNLPTITFHFEGGVDLTVQRNTGFIVWRRRNKEYVCLAIMPASKDNIAIIGTQYQANHVVVYDLLLKMMYFGPRNCGLQN